MIDFHQRFTNSKGDAGKKSGRDGTVMGWLEGERDEVQMKSP